MASRFKKLDFTVIPPKEIDIDEYKDVFVEYLHNHPECTIIRARKKVPQNTEGLVVEVGLQDPLADDIFERYSKVAKDLAYLTSRKVTLIPTEIGIEAFPETEDEN